MLRTAFLITSAACAAFFVLGAGPGLCGPAIIPMEREGTLDTLPLGGALGPAGAGRERKSPAKERVRMKKQGIEDARGLGKKAPLVSIDPPEGFETKRSCRLLTGRVGAGITKVFLMINDQTRVVSTSDGAFESYVALDEGVNDVTVLAWDLDGNLGKDSVKLVYAPEDSTRRVRITSPGDGSSFEITYDRVIGVEADAGTGDVREAALVINGMPQRVSFEGGRMSQEAALLPGGARLFVEALYEDGSAAKSPAVTLQTFDARPKDLVAVLTWESDTADFDLHAWDSSGHHTFNEAKDPQVSRAAIPGGTLDLDRRGGYGPEVFSLESAEPEVYTFFVKYNSGLNGERGARATLSILLYGDEPSRRILRSFGPVFLDGENPVWEAAHVKMPEGVFFQEKGEDLKKTLGMDEGAAGRLAMMLEEESPAFARLAISALGRIKSAGSVGPLLGALGSEDPTVRLAAAGALWNIRPAASADSVDGLIAALSDPDLRVRRAAAGALGAIGDRRAAAGIARLLGEDQPEELRREAIRSLGMLADAGSVEALAVQAADPRPGVRAEAVRALGKMKDKRALGVLKAALEDGSPGVRDAAARGLGRLGFQEGERPLLDALYFDADEAVRVSAASSLGLLGGRSAKEELLRAREKDSSDRVRFAAARALERIAARDKRADKARGGPKEAAQDGGRTDEAAGYDRSDEGAGADEPYMTPDDYVSPGRLDEDVVVY